MSNILLIVAAIAIITGGVEFLLWYRKNKNNNQIVFKILEIVKEDIVNSISETMNFLKSSILTYDNYEAFENAVKTAAVVKVKNIINKNCPEYASYLNDILLRKIIDIVIDSNSIELSLKEYYNEVVCEEITNTESEVVTNGNDPNVEKIDSDQPPETVDISNEINKIYKDNV